MGRLGKLELIGHRGAAGRAPENTLVSFEKAINMGATMLELDVHLSKDGKLMVIHDHDITRTTTGNGLVENMTLEEIRQYDAGSWMNSDFRGEKIPTLQEVLDLVDGRVSLNIEIKAGEQVYAGLVDKLIDVIAQYDAQIVISSFHREYLKEIKEKAPAIEVALLYSRDLPDVLDEAVNERWEGLHPYYKLVDAKLMEGARRRGLAVRAWTVDEPGDMTHLIQLGVDGICTNFPDILRSVVTDLEI